MIRLKLDMDEDTWEILVQAAIKERRSISQQAEVVIMRAMGTYPPLEESPDATQPD